MLCRRITNRSYDRLYLKNLGVVIIAGIIVGFVSILVSKVLEDI